MLTITVAGPPKSGKTTTAVKIAAMLQSNGHRVRLIDTGPTAHDFGGQFEDDHPEFQVVTEQQ